MVNELSSNLSASALSGTASEASRQTQTRQSDTRPAVSQVTVVEDTTGPTESVQATPSTQALNETVSRLNEAAQVVKRDLQFRVDDDSGRTVITVLDSETEEVIRQIPPEQVLTLAKNIESLKGMLFSAEA